MLYKLTMDILSIGFIFLLICYVNGLWEENAYLDKGFADLETLPLKKLLEMKKELRNKDYPVRRTSAGAVEKDDGVNRMPNAMALRRTDFLQESSAAAAVGSSMQTAFQMSLTVLSFLAFGGYVISLVAQNMRKPQQNDGMTAPQPLKTVVVNQNRRPLRPITTVSFGRRKRSRRNFA